MNRLADWLLAFLQRRCEHPDNMVAVDITEGDFEHGAISYCRRCGAVKVERHWPLRETPWRLPDPHLWRGHARRTAV